MELKEFIKMAILDITSAVSEIEDGLANKGVIVNPPIDFLNKDRVGISDGKLNGYRQVQNIDFNVAVTASEKEGNKSGLSIVTGLFGVGAAKSNDLSLLTVNTIKFSIPISLPFKELEPISGRSWA